MIVFAVNTCIQCFYDRNFSQYFKVLRAGKYLSNQQFRSDQKRTLNHVLNPFMNPTNRLERSWLLHHLTSRSPKNESKSSRCDDWQTGNWVIAGKMVWLDQFSVFCRLCRTTIIKIGSEFKIKIFILWFGKGSIPAFASSYFDFIKFYKEPVGDVFFAGKVFFLVS